MNHPTPRIVQIIPATGWRWKLRGEPESWPLTCWALVERDHQDGDPPERDIEGVDLQCEGLHGLVEDWAWERRQNGDGEHLFIEYLPPGEGPTP